ncbi:hypothetical protein BC940DRAFT_307988 [Gongronella butleri]|nr:hypothetical protein BC940DRAFT_307988 [Gongronella butleri]
MPATKENIETTKLYSFISFLVVWIDTIVKNYIRVKATLDAIVFVAQEKQAQTTTSTSSRPVSPTSSSRSVRRRASSMMFSMALIDQLPSSLLQVIFSHVARPGQLYQCTLVSHRWHRLVTPILWRDPALDTFVLAASRSSSSISSSNTNRKEWRRRRCVSTISPSSSTTTPLFQQQQQHQQQQPSPHATASSPLHPRQQQQQHRRQLSNNLGGDRPFISAKDAHASSATSNLLATLSKSMYGQSVRRLSLQAVAAHVTDDLLLFVLQQCPNITILDLSHCRRLTAMGYHHLARSACAPLLTQLVLSGCATLSDRDCHILATTCRRLEKLNMAACPRVTDDGVRALIGASRQSLRYINVRDCLRLSGHILQDMASQCGPRLLGVDATRICSIVHADIHALVHHCPQLEQLYVGRNRSPLVCQLQQRMRHEKDDVDKNDNSDRNASVAGQRTHRPVATSMINRPAALTSLVQVIQQRERKERLRHLSQPTASPFAPLSPSSSSSTNSDQDVSQATVDLIIRRLTRLKAIDLSHWSCLTDKHVRNLWQHGRMEHVGLDGVEPSSVTLHP